MDCYPDPPENFDAVAYLHVVAAAVGLSLPQDAIRETALNLERAAGFARLLIEVPNIETVESATVFHAGLER